MAQDPRHRPDSEHGRAVPVLRCRREQGIEVEQAYATLSTRSASIQ